jgi:hypothetical protein
MARLRRSSYEREQERDEKRRKAQRIGAMTRGELELLEKRVYRLRDRVLASKATYLTNDDLMTIFVKPEWHEMCRLGPAVLSNCGTGGYFGHRCDGIMVNIQPSEMPYAYPTDMGQRVRNDGEEYAKIKAWLDWRIETGRRWALVMEVLRELAARCADVQTMRFFWPALPALMGDKAQGMDAPKAVPALPAALKAACVTTVEAVTLALMLPEEDLEQAVGLCVDPRALPNAPLPWGLTASL